MIIQVKQRHDHKRYQAPKTMPERPEEPTPPFSYSTTVCVYAATDCGFAHRRHAGGRSKTVLGGVPYYGRRYYNPGLGRWINRDPIGEFGGKNLYATDNNFINNIDLLGMVPQEVVDMIDLLLSAGTCIPGAGLPLGIAGLIWAGLTGHEEISENNPLIAHVDGCPPRPRIRDLDRGCDPLEDGLGVQEITYSCGPWEDPPDPVVNTVKNFEVNNFLVNGVSYQQESTCLSKECSCCPDDEGWNWSCGEDHKAVVYKRCRIAITQKVVLH
jgi:RHS repeat-associated protein